MPQFLLYPTLFCADEKPQQNQNLPPPFLPEPSFLSKTSSKLVTSLWVMKVNKGIRCM